MDSLNRDLLEKLNGWSSDNEDIEFNFTPMRGDTEKFVCDPERGSYF